MTCGAFASISLHSLSVEILDPIQGNSLRDSVPLGLGSAPSFQLTEMSLVYEYLACASLTYSVYTNITASPAVASLSSIDDGRKPGSRQGWRRRSAGDRLTFQASATNIGRLPGRVAVLTADGSFAHTDLERRKAVEQHRPTGLDMVSKYADER